jgi:hypothetical protein
MGEHSHLPYMTNVACVLEMTARVLDATEFRIAGANGTVAAFVVAMGRAALAVTAL